MSQLPEHIERHLSETTRLLGLKYDQLIGLITHAENLYNPQKKVQDNSKIRIIKGGGSRPPKLEIAAQILLSLVDLHHLPTFQILGVQFGVSESAANYIFHKWIKIFRELLPAQRVRAGKKNDSEWQWVIEILSKFEQIVDSHKQPRERLTDYKKQKKYYSGKQKKPTLKNPIVVMPNGKKIVDVVMLETAKTADIKIWRSRRKEWNPEHKFQGDKAYVGELLIDTRHKKTQSKDITDAQKKAHKQNVKKKRIIVQHMIRLVKI